VSVPGPAPDDAPHGDPSFATTRWTDVVAAGGRDPAAARAALETMCRAYWYPLYADARRRGADVHRASDLVQGFFAALLEKGWVEDADPARGRFRAFLLTAFRRFDAKDHAKAVAAKRGGDVRIVPIDATGGESRLRLEPSHGLTPDRAFDRRYALTLLGRALDRTREEFLRTHPAAHFDALAPFLGGAGEELAHADLAAALGTTPGAVRVTVHRLRARYGRNLRAEVRDTVADDAAVDDELRQLRQSLAGE